MKYFKIYVLHFKKTQFVRTVHKKIMSCYSAKIVIFANSAKKVYCKRLSLLRAQNKLSYRHNFFLYVHLKYKFFWIFVNNKIMKKMALFRKIE